MDARERLDQAMNERRLDLRIRWVEVARRASMSVTNLNLIRKGRIAITDLAAANLEDALEWEQGHIARVLAEGDESVDPLTGDPEEIGRLVEAYRKLNGSDAAAALLQTLLQANIQASTKAVKKPATSSDDKPLQGASPPE